jgi:hypothetical protein
MVRCEDEVVFAPNPGNGGPGCFLLLGGQTRAGVGPARNYCPVCYSDGVRPQMLHGSGLRV